MANVSGIKQLQNAEVFKMDQQHALDKLDEIGKSKGGDRLRENSRTFTKSRKRDAFNLELRKCRKAVCQGNSQLEQIWDRATKQTGNYDMTGKDLQSMITELRSELNKPEISPPIGNLLLGSGAKFGADAFYSTYRECYEGLQDPDFDTNDKAKLQDDISKAVEQFHNGQSMDAMQTLKDAYDQIWDEPLDLEALLADAQSEVDDSDNVSVSDNASVSDDFSVRADRSPSDATDIAPDLDDDDEEYLKKMIDQQAAKDLAAQENQPEPLKKGQDFEQQLGDLAMGNDIMMDDVIDEMENDPEESMQREMSVSQSNVETPGNDIDDYDEEESMKTEASKSTSDFDPVVRNRLDSIQNDEEIVDDGDTPGFGNIPDLNSASNENATPGGDVRDRQDSMYEEEMDNDETLR